HAVLKRVWVPPVDARDGKEELLVKLAMPKLNDDLRLTTLDESLATQRICQLRLFGQNGLRRHAEAGDFRLDLFDVVDIGIVRAIDGICLVLDGHIVSAAVDAQTVSDDLMPRVRLACLVVLNAIIEALSLQVEGAPPF